MHEITVEVKIRLKDKEFSAGKFINCKKYHIIKARERHLFSVTFFLNLTKSKFLTGEMCEYIRKCNTEYYLLTEMLSELSNETRDIKLDMQPIENILLEKIGNDDISCGYQLELPFFGAHCHAGN